MDRETQVQINRVKDVIVHRLKDKGFLSLYLGGTVPSRDRVPDTFVIVELAFDFKEEEKVNRYLRGCLKEEIEIDTTFNSCEKCYNNRCYNHDYSFGLRTYSGGKG